MKIIDELQRCANGECLCKRAMFNKKCYEYNGTSVVQQIIQEYGMCPELLNAELEEVEDKEYEDIDLLRDDNFIITNEAHYPLNKVEIALKDTINALIRNQKYILERLDK